MTLEQVIASILRAIVAGFGGGTASPPPPSTLSPLWETPDGLLTMKAMRYQLVKASGLSEVWGFGGSKTNAEVVAEMEKIKGYCEPRG